METTRRNFLKGAFAVGVGAAAATIPGCSPASEGSATSVESGNGIGKHTWEVAPEPITDIAETKDYDVVVVGGGMAGVNAAQAAAREGAKVALIERNSQCRFCGADLAAIGSKKLKEAGIEIDIDEAVRLQHLWSQQTANYDLIRNWAEQCGPVIDYITELCEANGVTVTAASGGGTAKAGWDQLPEDWRVYTDAVRFSSDSGEEVSEPHEFLGRVLVKSAEEYGAEFFYNTHGEQLVGDAASGITGVIATGEDGKYIQFNASKGVVLATGDIGGNQEMVDAWAPLCNKADGNCYAPTGANTGDAILMGSWAGAALSRSSAAPMVHQFTLDSRSFGFAAFNMTWLAVNADGVRYGAEIPYEPYLTNARMSTAGNKAWSIFDSDYEKYMKKQYPTSYESLLESGESEMEDRLATGELVKADTLEDLAEQLGIPVDTFLATVEEYNGMYAKGADTKFGLPETFLSEIKTAPFYAFPVYASILTIIYGLHVNTDSQVLTDEETPIDGLYAIGNAQGDFFGGTYPVHLPGCSTSRCVVYGQLIGEALAKGTTITELIA